MKRLGLLLLFSVSLAFADDKITQLPAATTQAGTELLPEVQTGQCAATGGTCKVTSAQVAAAGTLTGDVSKAAGSTAATVLKLNGVTPAPIATSGSASDLSAGTVNVLRLPAFSGDCTTPGGSGVLTCTKLNGTTPGGSCTNQAVTSLSASAVPSCTTLTSAYVDTSIAKTGTDINTSNQVVSTHLAAPQTTGQGGTGTGSTLSGIVRGGSAYTAAELSGDCTTSGSNAVTCSKVNGGSFPTSAVVVGTNSSAQPVAATTTGTGTTAVLANSPTLVTPSLGTPSAIDLTNATNLPASAIPATTIIPATNVGGPLIISVSGTTYSPTCATINSALIQFTSATAVTFNLPASSTSGCGAQFSFSMQVLGVGTVTVTPTTSTIKYNSSAGAATLAVPQGSGADLTGDGTNYGASECTACITGLPLLTTVGTIGTGTWQGTTIASTYGGSGVSNPTAHDVAIAEGSSPFNFIAGGTNCVLTWSAASSDPTCNASPSLSSPTLSSPKISNRISNGSGNPISTVTNPTAAACTSPSVTGGSGTFMFTVNVGTSCGTGVLTLTFGTASNNTGWGCYVQDVTSNSSIVVGQTGFTSTTVSAFQAYSRTTGTTVNFNSSDVLVASCAAN